MTAKIIQLISLLTMIWGNVLWSQQEITFSVKPFPAPKSVHVVGDFNNWSKTANPLSDPDGDGIWKTKIALTPGEYEYRFLLNEMIWIKDPGNPVWGGEHSNSIIRVKSPQQPELKNISPANGSTCQASKLVIEAQYIDGIEKHGLDIRNTRVILNSQLQKFSFNKKLNKIECYLDDVKNGQYQAEIQAQDMEGNIAFPVISYFLVKNSNSPPVVDAGYTIIAGINSMVHLNSGSCYDPDNDPLRKYDWKLISRPEGSKANLENDNSAFPGFKPDKVGRYLFTLHLSDGETWSNTDSVDVYAFIKRDYPVDFSLSDSAVSAIYEMKIDSAAVAGEFNHWSATANRMNDYNHDGVWTTWIDLDPGEYEYKFVVNGNLWIPDPNNPVKVPDGWNGFNSVVTAFFNLAPVVSLNVSLGPGKIVFDAASSYSRLGTNLTFLWYQDINNCQRFDLPFHDKISIPTPKQFGIYYFYLVAIDQFGVSSGKTVVLHVDKGGIKIRDFSDSPDWAKDAIVYEVLVRKFTPDGNLKGLINKIPYLKMLGINCLWLMPIWEGPTSNGYGPTDFFAIEKDYGTLDDFKALVAAAHDAGIRIILDFIANHTSDQHPYFLSAYHNPDSNFRDWYRWGSQGNKVGYYPYEFHNDWDNLPNLNYENPNVRQYIIDAAVFWARLGVDGFRCDVAWGVPHDFWKLFRRSLKNVNPDFLTIDEVLPRSPSYHKDEFDMSYDTDFYGNLLDVMNGRKPLSAIDYGLRKTQKNYPAHALDFRYLENHDMERFITQFGLNKTRLAAALLLTIPGTPMIYYGQEIGLREKTPLMEWDKQDDLFFTFYKKLLLFRRSHLCFRRGTMIKVPTNAEADVSAFLRNSEDESFLIILNFGNRIEGCQLLFPEGVLEPGQGGRLNLENALTSEIIAVDFIQPNQIKLNLAAEYPYIFKLRTYLRKLINE